MRRTSRSPLEIIRWFRDSSAQQNWPGNGIHFDGLVSWYGRKQLIPVYIEDYIFIFFLNEEVNSTENKSVNNSDSRTSGSTLKLLMSNPPISSSGSLFVSFGFDTHMGCALVVPRQKQVDESQSQTFSFSQTFL